MPPTLSSKMLSKKPQRVTVKAFICDKLNGVVNLRFLTILSHTCCQSLTVHCEGALYAASFSFSEAFAAINFPNHLVHTLSPTSFSQQSALYLRSHILVMLYVINLTIFFFVLSILQFAQFLE